MTETSREAWARQSRARREIGLENYRYIRGDLMSAAEAAARLGVSERTVTRWRAALRAQETNGGTRPMNKPLSVSEPVYDRLTELRDEMRAKLNRRVSYTEVMERLLELEQRERAELAGRHE